MHINVKILKAIKSALLSKYYINLQPDDWKPFQEPLTDDRGNVDSEKFRIRQDQSIKIINVILDRHGKADILKFLAELATIEPKIQALQPWVRDHIVHAINTFILGVFILEKLKFPKKISSRYGYPFMWKLCGPTHDLGYPLEIARKVEAPFIDKMNAVFDSIKSPTSRLVISAFPSGLNELCNERSASESIQARLKEWSIGIDVEDYFGWLRAKNRTDHGVISALAEMKIIDALYQRRNPSRKTEDIIFENLNFNELNFTQDITSACSAIFLHNIDPTYKGFSEKVNFKVAPLAFLLILCDTFQEWDRQSENRRVFSGEDFDIRCSAKSISLFVPKVLEKKMAAVLSKRLSGLKVSINKELVVE